MVTQPFLERKNYFKRPVIWESFDTDKGLIAPPGRPCGCFENGIIFGPHLFARQVCFALGKQLRDAKNRRKTTLFAYSSLILLFISKTRRITSHFVLEAAVKVP